MMRIRKVVFTIISLTAVLSAQQNSASPVQAKRLPQDKSKRTVNPISTSLLDQYDFAAQISALQADGSVRTGETVKPLIATPATPAIIEAGVPPGFRPKTDVQLTQTAQEAVQMSEKWMAEHNQPAVGRDGRILYSYGAGLPTVVCAPLRVCMIELQAGEKLVGEPQIGDSVRWNL